MASPPGTVPARLLGSPRPRRGRWLTTSLPTGTVTFLFTDIEGSTRLLRRLGDAFRVVLEDHHRMLREAVAAAGGDEVATTGDGVFAVFTAAPGAVSAAVAAQRALSAHDWPDASEVRVRMGIHTGLGVLGGDDYVGIDVHRAARIADAAHGGQVLLSDAARALLDTTSPPDVTLRDLGRHRLKDLAEPERLHQVVVPGLAADFPPLRTLDAVANNLPVQLTTFVGRRHEVARARELLAGTRLLTLTGPGGTGKTRLALQVAAEAATDHADGVTFTDLSAVREPDLVPSAIARTLGLAHAEGRPEERIATYLADRKMVLVLDNFEQILDASGLVTDLLRAAPEVRLVVTSRAPLRVRGEQELAVPPLTVPAAGGHGRDEAVEGEAVDLFVERSALVAPDRSFDADDLAAIAEIVERLDGLPLAIELAAARTRLLSPRTIADRLATDSALLRGGPRDAPRRQRALAATIAWSHDLLDRPARRVFARFAVFAGGATLEDVEEVCGPADELGGNILDAVATLVDHSLLRRDDDGEGTRFTMLQTLRDDARERLEASGKASTIRARHAQRFLTLAEEAELHLDGWDHRRWLDRLDTEHDNLRAAFTWAIGERDADSALRLCGALWRFWQTRGHLHEARTRVDDALALPGGADGSRLRALRAAGGVAYWQGRIGDARGLYERGLELARAVSDRTATAWALFDLSFTHVMVDDPDVGRARRLLAESERIFDELGDDVGRAQVTYGRGSLHYWEGDLGRAEAEFERALRLFEDAGDRFWIGGIHGMLAACLVRDGRFEEAVPHLQEGLALYVGSGAISQVVLGLDLFATVAAATGRVERALRLRGAVDELRRSSGAELVDVTRSDEGDEALADVPDAEAERLAADGRRMSLEEAVAYALTPAPPEDRA